MPKDIKSLEDSLKNNPAARAKFLAEMLEFLRKNGVDVDDPDVLKSLNVDFDLNDGQKFVEGLRASTVVITNVF